MLKGVKSEGRRGRTWEAPKRPNAAQAEYNRSAALVFPWSARSNAGGPDVPQVRESPITWRRAAGPRFAPVRSKDRRRGARYRIKRWESTLAKSTTFEHGGRTYEVRAIPTLNGWMVRIFVDGIPANGFTYSINSEIYQDAALNRVPEDLVAGLMETAERDFRRGLTEIDDG